MFGTGTDDRSSRVRTPGAFKKRTFATMGRNLNSATGRAYAFVLFTGTHPSRANT
ncbi:hypothetical protein [Arthrobacter globiformis]|uniref:Uncharacterized protein n=2 Tax=Arthrobacter TaxID=1663 RepID=H0QLH6_ARTG1|nr:hypothetical protein [Arthrobacter globiformis]GAB13677.1 hypothetical protein ARGLB_047_00270 [Arthrobacter globiformis NBRC 12137]